MVNCFQFCFNFAFNFDLRRYMMLSIRSRHVPNLTLVDMPAWAYTRPLFGFT
jgi:hypothetical protein